MSHQVLLMEKNPAPVDMEHIPLFAGFHTCWVVPDFWTMNTRSTNNIFENLGGEQRSRFKIFDFEISSQKNRDSELAKKARKTNPGNCSTSGPKVAFKRIGSFKGYLIPFPKSASLRRMAVRRPRHPQTCLSWRWCGWRGSWGAMSSLTLLDCGCM